MTWLFVCACTDAREPPARIAAAVVIERIVFILASLNSERPSEANCNEAHAGGASHERVILPE
jgi:hypothetical protein